LDHLIPLPPPQRSTISDLDGRILRVARALQEAFAALLEAAVGPSPRPARLVRELSLDKSLAGRLVRSLRSGSPMHLIDLIPSPIGLRMVVDATASKGVEQSLLDPARRAIDQFERLLQEVPGGRNSLDALLSTTVPETKERTEKSAQQAVYRAMTQLLGLHCEAVTSAVILQPAASGRFADAIDVQHRAGIRHLRPNTPVAVHSALYGTEDAGAGPRLETLRGEPPERSPRTFLLPEFCTRPLPPLREYHDGPHSILALDEARLTLHEPVTITTAFLVRDGFLADAQPEAEEEWRSYLLACPSKLVVRDLFIRDDLYVGALPEVRLEFPLPPGAKRLNPKVVPKRLAELDLSAPIEQLGFGLARAGVSRVPAHGRLLAHVFAEAGWDPARFRGYRCRMGYPVPMVTMGWWIPLSTGPGPS